MKKLSFRLMLIVFLLGSCQQTNVNNGQIVDPAITTGSWYITLFTDSGNDETSDFSGYTFIFEKNGVLTASKNTVSTAGTWNKGSKFSIDLGVKSNTNKPLGELTDNWQIISTDATHIILGDDNLSGGEKLTFSKN